MTELSGRTVNYGYDSIYRLTSETIASDPNNVNGAASYVYDAMGNRTQKTSTISGYPGGLTNYNANDEIATDTYDSNGNTTASNGLGYVYDFENHVIQAGAGITMVYDGDGNRFSKTVGGVTTKYLVDPQSPTGYAQVVYETFSGSTSPNHDISRIFVYGLERISQLRSYFTNSVSHTQTSYYVYDGHGSTRALTDPTGAVTDTYDYDAFGNIVHSTATGIPPGGTTVAPTPNEFLFAGEQFDSDLNLYYNRARYLNTSTGRFWTMDDMDADPDSPESLHRYLYAQADPANLVDPSGNQGFISAVGAEALMNILVATVVTATALAALNFVRVAVGNTATGAAGELYDEASYAAGRLIAAATAAYIVLYASLSDAINRAADRLKDRIRDQLRRLRLKVVPISRTIMPNIAAHITGALSAGHPEELTRTTLEEAAKNRFEALAGLGSAPPGMSWDEYPFASSEQGGKGASVVAVPRGEQNIQGGVIAGSYALQNIRAGDSYFVVIIP